MSVVAVGVEKTEIYVALVRERCAIDGVGEKPKDVAEQFRLHLHRGIGVLVGVRLSSINGLICSIIEKESRWPKVQSGS